MSKPKIAEYDEAITTLDEMHAAGEMSDAEHAKRRAALVKEREALLPPAGSVARKRLQLDADLAARKLSKDLYYTESGRLDEELAKAKDTVHTYKVAGIGCLGLVVIVILIAVAVSIGGETTKQDPVASRYPPLSKTTEVAYYVTGEGATSVQVTMQTPTGQTQVDADLPLSTEDGTEGLYFTAFSAGAFLYISAQNQDTGSITCRIEVDGTVISQNTATADYGIATCEGTL